MPTDRPYFLHPQGLVDSGAQVGDGTRVWAFAHVTSGAVVGRDCNLCDHTFLESGVILGDRVTVKTGVYLWTGVVVEDDVFIGPGAGFGNDRTPRSKRQPPRWARTLLKKGCSIGTNAVCVPGITVGRWAMVGAGAVATRDVPDFALVVGNPARQTGWVCICGHRLPDVTGPRATAAPGTHSCGNCGERFELGPASVVHLGRD